MSQDPEIKDGQWFLRWRCRDDGTWRPVCGQVESVTPWRVARGNSGYRKRETFLAALADGRVSLLTSPREPIVARGFTMDELSETASRLLAEGETTDE
jgi:hypothetical protein